MPYDPELAHRLREALSNEPGLTERAMFGGLAFLLDGNMAVSASSRGDLMVRVDPGQMEALTTEPHVRRFVMRERELDGWLRVDAAGLDGEDDLLRWVRLGVAYARTLAPK